jgi:hypothetical protein
MISVQDLYQCKEWILTIAQGDLCRRWWTRFLTGLVISSIYDYLGIDRQIYLFTDIW